MDIADPKTLSRMSLPFFFSAPVALLLVRWSDIVWHESENAAIKGDK